MATFAEWVEGARPRTLPAAVAPIFVGAGATAVSARIVWGYAVLAMVVALLLQIGVNYANDYSDGIRGTDEDRVGPMRLVGSGAAEPGAVKAAAFTCFFFAALFGLALVALSGVWLMIPIGAAAVLAAWYYTGGKRPYGYMGLGELFVFIFFGLVATLGTMATMTPLTWVGWVGAVGVGALASAILVANNLRDIPTDIEAGKRTLATRLGDRGTRWFYFLLVLLPFVATGILASQWPWALLSLLATPIIVRPVRAVMGGAQGRNLIPALGGTGIFEVVWALLLMVGLIVS